MEGNVPKHLDSRRVWHRVGPERCRCGCARLRSLEDPTLVWECGDLEPESHLGYCRDRLCPCHVSPVHGEPGLDGSPSSWSQRVSRRHQCDRSLHGECRPREP